VEQTERRCHEPRPPPHRGRHRGIARLDGEEEDARGDGRLIGACGAPRGRRGGDERDAVPECERGHGRGDAPERSREQDEAEDEEQMIGAARMLDAEPDVGTGASRRAAAGIGTAAWPAEPAAAHLPVGEDDADDRARRPAP
jgi:hypothetical protein